MKTIKLFLKYIKATGKDSSGSRCVIICDCILRFDNEGKIWTIVSDDQRNVVVQAKTAVSNIKNPCPIPIDIEDFEKRLKTFNNKDLITVKYDKEFISLNKVETRESLVSDIKTKITFKTKSEELIQNDLILDLYYGDDNDKRNLINIKRLGDNIYKNGAHEAKLFFGMNLKNNMIIPAKHLKLIINDGEKLKNREYQFNFKEHSLNVTNENRCFEKKEKIRRNFYSKTYNINKPFTINFSNRLTNAVNNIRGNVELFAEEEAPMLIRRLPEDKNEIDYAYLVTTF